MFAIEGRAGARRAFLVGCAFTLIVGCGTDGGGSGGLDSGFDPAEMGPVTPPDAGTVPTPDMGVVTPPYQAQPLSCTGSVPSCGSFEGNRTQCEAVQGCDAGYCDFRPLSCLGSAPYQCESGCSWDDYRCVRNYRACSATSESACRRVAACQWNSTVTFPFYDIPCQGVATPCTELSGAACLAQEGCSLGCPFGRQECESTCVDTRQDDNHCGACQNACGDDASCVSGVCQCDTPGFSRDLCGVCDADPTNNCVRDCAGVPGGDGVLDDCGVCDANPFNDCDCAGVPGGPSHVDMCGECDANYADDCVQDCAGVWGGGATTDVCGVCDDDMSNDCDCALVPGGPSRLDMCGVCDDDMSNDCAIDCSGVWGGLDRLDMCGVCDADPNNDCAEDCAGTWGGSAALDMCGVCDTNPNNDCEQDCAGVWGGSAALDRCGACDTDPTNDCVCLGVTCVGSNPCFEGYCDLVSDTCQERPLPDGLICDPSGAGICVEQECVARGCGDGYRERGDDPAWPREGCDDRNLADGDSCSVACVPTEYVTPYQPGPGGFDVWFTEYGRLLVFDGLGNGLMVWRERHWDSGNSRQELRASRLDRFGNMLDADAPMLLDTTSSISFEAYPSAVGLSTGGFVVGWTARRSPPNQFLLLMRRIQVDGTIGAEERVDLNTSYHQRRPQFTALNNSFVVVWEDGNRPAGLWARRFGNTSGALSARFALPTSTDGTRSAPSIASHGDEWMATWYWQGPSFGVAQVRARRFLNNDPLEDEFVVVPEGASTQSVIALGDDYLLTYAARINGNITDLYARSIPRAVGGAAGDAVPVDVDPTRGVARPSAAPYGPEGQGGYVVVYTDWSSNPRPLFKVVGVTPPSELDTLELVTLGEDYPVVAAAPYDLTGGSVWFGYTRQPRGTAVLFQLPPP